jgi:methionine synthase I (cobalamin-dependent)/5,10-methylenetetrahydrofolate reductase
MPMREPLLERIQTRTIVADGAMGTMVYAKGIPFSRCFDELNLSWPQLVKEVHLDYVKAGAEILETNTFGASRSRLAKYDLGDSVREINLAGARLAREVAGDDLYVAGSVGPLGLHLEPLGPTSREEGRALFREQIAALVEGEVDAILLETMVDLEEAHQALLAARDVTNLPVIVQMTVQEDGCTLSGTAPEDFTRTLDEWGADIIGLNCSVGPAGILETLERMSKVTRRRLSAQPNAGLPQTVNGRSLYLCSPDYMAEYARRFVELGARIVGGCCGTSPEHIRAIKKAVRSVTPRGAQASVEVREKIAPPLEPIPVEQRSGLARKLARGEFPILVEMLPPKGCDATRELEGAHYLREQQIDGINILDHPGGTARMSAHSLAVLIQQRARLESVLGYASRGRSVPTIQSDLLGASALGLANIVAITGVSRQSQSQPGLDLEVDSIGLVNIMNHLNQGLDAAGNPMGSQTSFLIGVRVNPATLNLDEEVHRFELKVEAGANFAVAQPVFETGQLLRFLKRVEVGGAPPIPIIAGVLALTSYRNAEFLNNEVPGMTVPDSILRRMRTADTGDQARAEGLKIAQETLLELRGLVQGVHISTPFGRYAMAVEVALALATPLDETSPTQPLVS